MTHRAHSLQAIWQVVAIAILGVGLVSFTAAFLFLTTLKNRGYDPIAIAEIAPVAWRYAIAAFLILTIFFLILYFAYLREALDEYTALYVLTIARDGKIMSINKTAPGLEKEKVLGTKIYKYIPEKSWGIAQRALKQTFTTAKPSQFDVQSIGEYGKPAFYRTGIEPVMLDGKVIAALFMSREIQPSERQKKAKR